MKGKRVLSLALAALMTLSLLVVPAAAVSFTDMTNHWAKDDVEYLATQGVVKGTSATTFAPDQKMTACEALLFCSRATGVDAIDKEAIAEDWEDELKEILPEEMYAWAAQEMAVCLETGIISETELRALSSAGGLVKSITRETLAMYLVRAMQLAPLAQSLTSYPMSFADTTSISASLQPYVYLLNMYGIVKGNELNRFLPQNSLTRAEMATMLRRAIDFMDERGIYAELPGYTDYDWVGGTIAAVSTGSSGVTLLTLTSVVSGTRSISLPADAEIYENNMLSSADALKVGSYARVNLDRKGTAESVRLGGAVTSYTGSVTGVEQDSLTVTVNGASKRLDIDRFTEVQVGKTAGDYTLLDPQAGYTTATCYVDAMGHLDAVQLSGGTRAEEGILVKVENGTGGQRLQVSAFNGETRRYTLPAGAGVTVNGVVGTVSDRYEGDYVSLRVSNDEANELVSMAVDTVTDYVQGSVKSFTYAKDQNDITLTNLSTGKSTTYDISSKAAIRFNGEDIALKELERNSFATLQLSGGDVVTLLDAYPGSTTTEGVIESITYGTPTTLAVKTANDSVMTFELDLTDLPAIYRDGKSSSLDKIKSGDTVVVTVRYNKVTTLETTPQSANVTGTITRVVQDAAGITFDVKLTDGSTASYTVSEGVIESITYGTPTTLAVKTANDSVMTFELDLTDLPAIYRDGKSSSLDKIKSGDTVVVTVRYNKVTTLETTPQSANVTGTITRVVQDAAGITFDVKLTDGSTASYTVSEGVSVTQDGTAVSLYTLKPNDAVAMVVSGGDVVSIEVDRGSGSSSQLEGTVLVPNTKDKTLMVQLTDGNVLTADVSDASFMSASGSSTSLRQLEAGDRVQLFGDYKGAQFVATLVLKL